MPVQPYKDLYHIMGHTYGTWLSGDPKGFRTRHHREHVEGDYKNPPPRGKYDARHDHAKSLMNRAPVYLDVEQRRVALDAFVESLLKRDIPVRVCAIDRIHLHLQAPFPDHDPRHWVGIAKKESSHALKLAGIGIEGGIWAVRCKCLPVDDAGHEVASLKYIIDHGQRGAVVWIAPYIADWLETIQQSSQRSRDVSDTRFRRG